jgi:hypothetical protein
VIVWAVTAIAVRHSDVAPVNLAAVAVSVHTGALVVYVAWCWLDSHRLGWSM